MRRSTPFVACSSPPTRRCSRACRATRTSSSAWPVAGRPGPEYAEVVGFFAAMAACRIDLGRRARRRSRPRTHVQSRVREAIDAPRGADREAGRGARRRARSVAQSAVPGRVRRCARDGLSRPRRSRARRPSGPKPDRACAVRPHAHDASTRRTASSAHWDYCADLFERADDRADGAPVRRAASRRWRASRGAPLATLPLMDEATRAARRRRRERRVDRASDGERTVHRRFAAQAAARPDGARDRHAELRGARRGVEPARRRAPSRAGAGPGAFVAVARERAAPTSPSRGSPC